MKLIRHRRWLIALLVIVVGVLVGLAWLVWPERPKDLTVRLKYLGNAVVDGKNRFLFRLEGADAYKIFIMPDSVTYLCGENTYSYSNRVAFEKDVGREFFIESPEYYYPNSINQPWKLRADIIVSIRYKNTLARFGHATTDAWQISRSNMRDHSTHPSFFSTAKLLWKENPMRHLSKQRITSELITTNAPPH